MHRLRALTRPSAGRLHRGLLAAAFVGAVGVLGLLLAGALPAMLGYDSFVVLGGSMSPAVRPGSILVAERVGPSTLEIGDIVTFRRAQSPTTPVTHRIVGIDEGEDGQRIFLTKGDANPFADPEELTVDQPISRLLYTVPYVGYLVAFARTLLGRLLLIGLPLAALGAHIAWRRYRERKPAGADAPEVVSAAPEPVSDAAPSVSARLDLPEQRSPLSILERPPSAPVAPAPELEPEERSMPEALPLAVGAEALSIPVERPQEGTASQSSPAPVPERVPDAPAGPTLLRFPMAERSVQVHDTDIELEPPTPEPPQAAPIAGARVEPSGGRTLRLTWLALAWTARLAARLAVAGAPLVLRDARILGRAGVDRRNGRRVGEGDAMPDRQQHEQDGGSDEHRAQHRQAGG